MFVLDVHRILYDVLRSVDPAREHVLREVLLAGEILVQFAQHTIIRQKLESEDLVVVVRKLCSLL